MLIFSTVPVPIAPGTFCRVSPAALESHLKSTILSLEAAAKKSLYILILSVSLLFAKKKSQLQSTARLRHLSPPKKLVPPRS